MFYSRYVSRKIDCEGVGVGVCDYHEVSYLRVPPGTQCVFVDNLEVIGIHLSL